MKRGLVRLDLSVLERQAKRARYASKATVNLKAKIDDDLVHYEIYCVGDHYPHKFRVTPKKALWLAGRLIHAANETIDLRERKRKAKLKR